MSEEQIESCFIGLDVSFTGTGMVVKRGTNITIETIKTEPKNFANDLVRIIHIRDAIIGKIPADVKMVCIEDIFSGMHPGSGVRLAMLASAVRLALYEKGMSFVVVSPTSLKKHVMGKGKGQKDLIIREVYKRYGYEVVDSNQADAVVLCHIGAQFYLAAVMGNKLDTIPEYQKEVVKNLIKSINERGYNVPKK